MIAFFYTILLHLLVFLVRDGHCTIFANNTEIVKSMNHNSLSYKQQIGLDVSKMKVELLQNVNNTDLALED